ncbi:hypothetical protein B0T22DRAFT_159070 [Podospora appendiculata]|uniref:Uncharacterized protein n=1 Tax=Podospora appendiculata TaxID=314037 RepID=A0AAE0X9S2_9PEZI|nr:hypothetical protein B0T22DRAFT_159070 [Podospora appendiculata]
MAEQHYSFEPEISAVGNAVGNAASDAVKSHIWEIAALMQTSADYNQGDSVLAIVTFPKDKNPGTACNGRPWQDLHLRMNYARLMSLGSTKITEMLQPRWQARFRRRHNMENSLPPGIDHLLDFTPSDEGSEQADLTAALWLPKGVKMWYLAGHYIPKPILRTGPVSAGISRPLAEKAVGATLALGHDDVCKSPVCEFICHPDVSQWAVAENTPGIFEDPSVPIPHFRRIEDYCPIRHRVAIMRVLRAINGHGLLLNSAPRMWTVAQVAMHLEVPSSVVDPITQWLIAPPNTKFIEVCPEKAFQLALGLRIPSVLTAAFRILVNELAIDYAAATPVQKRPETTWAQRKRDDYGDFPSDPVEYASRALVDRMNSKLAMLLSDDVFSRFDFGIDQWDRLLHSSRMAHHLGDADSKAACENLKAALLAVFHDRVNDALHKDAPVGHLASLIDAQRRHYLKDPTQLMTLYHGLDPSQRILVPFFWQELKDVGAVSTLSQALYNGDSLATVVSTYNAHRRRIRDPPSHTFAADSEFVPPFQLDEFLADLRHCLLVMCNQVLDRGSKDNDIVFFLSDHLILNLDEKELNYLPIWADGLDDDSGGVFLDVIPPTDMGPSEPGPSYHTGHTVGTDMSTMGGGPSTVAASDYGMRDLDLNDATVAGSMDAEQSVTTGIARNRVVAIGSLSGDSEQFSLGDHEFAAAMHNQPAPGQAHAEALVGYVEDVEGEDGRSDYDFENDDDTATMSDGSTIGRDDDDLDEFMNDVDVAESDGRSSTADASDFEMI